jgi:hypothetical protein
MLAAPEAPAAPDTVDAHVLARAPQLDGRIGTSEYGASSVRITTAQGAVNVWVGRNGGFLYIAAQLPDSSYYWGDDFVVSIDPDGSHGNAPGAGDMQWYLRRTADSSVVNVASAASPGRWAPPGRDGPSIKAVRSTNDWSIATSSDARGWSVELRIREEFVRVPGGTPHVLFRTFNDAPQGWWTWPAPPSGTPAQRLDHIPDYWVPLRFR